MQGLSIYRWLVAVGAFAAVFLPLLNLSEEGENLWPALIGALATGGIALLVREENWGQALVVGIAFCVGLVAGNALLAPQPAPPGGDVIFGIPVGAVCAAAYSIFIHWHDRQPNARRTSRKGPDRGRVADDIRKPTSSA